MFIDFVEALSKKFKSDITVKYVQISGVLLIFC